MSSLTNGNGIVSTSPKRKITTDDIEQRLTPSKPPAKKRD
jgi:hypothetical protein